MLGAFPDYWPFATAEGLLHFRGAREFPGQGVTQIGLDQAIPPSIWRRRT